MLESFIRRAAIVVAVLAVISLLVLLVVENQRTRLAIQQISTPAARPAGTSDAAAPPQNAVETVPPVVQTSDKVIARGRLVPMQMTDLAFTTGGLVESVFAREGQQVQVGEALAHLGNEEQILARIASAELDVLQAQQALDTLNREAPLRAAEALQDLVNAPIEVENAERAIRGLQTGTPTQSDIDIARANVTIAQNKLKAAEEAYRPYANKSEDNVTRALLLQRLAEAQREYDLAVARLNNLTGGASEADVAQAQADLELAKVRQQEAERRYEILKDGPDPDLVALAQARLTNAQAGLAAAQASLKELDLSAPFPGTLVRVNLQQGQFISPGVPVFTLVNLSEMHVETIDLTELNIVRVRPGQDVVVRFDALPDQEFFGTVERIRSQGENSQGDIIFSVVVNLKDLDPRLLWNMTCSVEIKTQ